MERRIFRHFQQFMGGYLISSIVLSIWKCIESHSNFLIKGEEVLWQQKF